MQSDNRPRPTSVAWIGFLAVALSSINLRPGATSAGTALPELRADLDLGSVAAGLLTALPGLAFAIFGVLAVPLTVRLGPARALVLGTVAIAGGLLWRATVSSWALFLLGSVLALSGMAIGNIVLPAFIKRFFPNRTSLMMTVYAVALAAGATGPGLIYAPMLAHAPGGWRSALGLWGVTAIVAVGPWVYFAARDRRSHTSGRAERGPSIWSVARSRQAVALAIFFGTQSMQAYVGFGWLPQILRDSGVSAGLASICSAVFAAWGLPAGMIVPALMARLRDIRPMIWAYGVLLVAGYLGLLLAPTAAPVLWVSLLGLAGFAFPTALVLIPARTRKPATTVPLSGFAQSAGYLIASIGPFAVGAIHGSAGGWTVPLIALMTTALVLVPSGLVAARPTYIDDELDPGTQVG